MMNLDTLLGFPKGHLNRLADMLCPPVSPELARNAITVSLRQTRTSSEKMPVQNTTRDTKNPRGFAEAAA